MKYIQNIKNILKKKYSVDVDKDTDLRQNFYKITNLLETEYLIGSTWDGGEPIPYKKEKFFARLKEECLRSDVNYNDAVKRIEQDETVICKPIHCLSGLYFKKDVKLKDEYKYQ